MSHEPEVSASVLRFHQAAQDAAQQAFRAETGQPLEPHLASAMAAAILRVVCAEVLDVCGARWPRGETRQ